MSEKRDTQAYQPLVSAVLRRHTRLHPQLPGGGAAFEDEHPPVQDGGPEILDELGADRPPVTVGETAAATVERLRPESAGERPP